MSKSKPSTSVSLHTFGCRLNQSETAGIQNALEADGYQVVDSKESADIVVINTCTVTENGDADTRRAVNKIRRINPEARIALVGCQAQVQKEKLAELPNVQWIVGNERKMDLAEVLREYPAGDDTHIITPPIQRKPFTQRGHGIDRRHTRANIKIQDGCDFFCSFCEIPYARGRARSRVFDDIMREVHILVESGHKEIVLTGINIGTYAYDGKGLPDVVKALNAVPGLERIRISSVEPTTVSDELIEMMAGGSKLCRYLHIPLQAGHDDVLTAMQRKYTLAEFDAFIRRVYRKVSQVCIGTDVIVGFPGEKDAHFQRAEDYLRESCINYFHVFSYSARNMARSRTWKKEVPPEVIQNRSRRLRALSQRKRRLHCEALLGTVQQVLFEQHKDGYWNGLTDNYVRVQMKSSVNVHNQLLPVRLERVEGAAVIGRVTAAESKHRRYDRS